MNYLTYETCLILKEAGVWQDIETEIVINEFWETRTINQYKSFLKFNRNPVILFIKAFNLKKL